MFRVDSNKFVNQFYCRFQFPFPALCGCGPNSLHDWPFQDEIQLAKHWSHMEKAKGGYPEKLCQRCPFEALRWRPWGGVLLPMLNVPNPCLPHCGFWDANLVGPESRCNSHYELTFCQVTNVTGGNVCKKWPEMQQWDACPMGGCCLVARGWTRFACNGES